MIVDRVLDEMADGRKREPGYTEVVNYEELAIYYAYTGNAEKAQEYVMLAFAASPAGIESRVLDSPLFDPVRKDANFRNAVAALRVELYERVRRLSETL